MNKNSFYHTLFILHKCTSAIKTLSEFALQLSNQRNPKNEEILMAVINYQILETTSFLEEYHERFNSNTDNDLNKRVTEVKSICKPIIKKLKQWKDLKKFRNEIIAHPWYSGLEAKLPGNIDYNIPGNMMEVTLLSHYLQYAYQIISYEFDYELNLAIEYAHRNQKARTPPKEKFKDINVVNQRMAKEVHELCKKFNKNYYLKIQHYTVQS